MKGPAPRWLLFLAGLAAGLTLSLVYAWFINPVKLVNADPSLLRSDHRAGWIRLAAVSYVAEGDLSRVRARLGSLERRDVEATLRGLMEEYARADRSVEAAHRMAVLAEALGMPAPSPMPRSRDSSTPDPATPAPAGTPPPATPSSLSSAAFRVAERAHVCRSRATPHIEVVVRGEDGQGLAGIKLWLLWPDGADWAMTGLKPSMGAGCADFTAEPGVEYTLGVGEIGLPLVSGLRLEPCPAEEEGEPSFGSWRIVIEQRPAETPGTSTPHSGRE